MMFCKNCGNQNADTAAFCAACGVALDSTGIGKKKHTGLIFGVIIGVLVVLCAALAVLSVKLLSKENTVNSANTSQNAVVSQTTKYIKVSDLEKAVLEMIHQEEFSVLEPYLVPNAKEALDASPELERIGGFLSNAYFERIRNIPVGFNPETVQSLSVEEIEALEKTDEESIADVIDKYNQHCVSVGLDFKIENIYIIEFEAVANYADGQEGYTPSILILATETEEGWRIIAIMA